MTKFKQQSESQLASQAPASQMTEPSRDVPRERIAERAYELYEERGRSGGGELDDWLTAERELTRGRPPRED